MMRNPRSGHGMTGGPILVMLLCIPFLVPFLPPLYLVDWLQKALGLSIPGPMDEGAWKVALVAELPWCIMVGYFWYWMKWSWWVPGIWITILVVLLIIGRTM